MIEIENIRNELNKKFGHIKFDDVPHTYTNTRTNHIYKTSASAIIENFVEPFDSKYWSEYKAKQRGVTADVILAEWKDISDEACRKGSDFHYMCECYYMGIPWKNEGQVCDKLVNMFNEYVKKIEGKLIHVQSEVVMADDELDIAGMCDQLYWSTHRNGLVLFDWKTNKKLELKSSYNNKMKGIFSYLDDCNYNHYSIQLAIYKFLIEKNTNLKILDNYIGWFNEKNDEAILHKCLDLQDIIKQIWHKDVA